MCLSETLRFSARIRRFLLGSLRKPAKLRDVARRRKRNRNVERVGAVIVRDALFKKLVEDTYAPIPPEAWETAVGSKIALRTRPYRIDRGTLHVMVSSSAWAQELSLLSETILRKLRDMKHEVGSLRFRVGSIEGTLRPTRVEQRTAMLPVPLPDEVQNALVAIGDVELRAALAIAAARNLGFVEAEERERQKQKPNVRARPVK